MESTTPGPWRVSTLNPALICSADGKLVALALRDLNNRTRDERAGNAAVIAIAPELVELVREAAAICYNADFRRRCGKLLARLG